MPTQNPYNHSIYQYIKKLTQHQKSQQVSQQVDLAKINVGRFKRKRILVIVIRNAENVRIAVRIFQNIVTLILVGAIPRNDVPIITTKETLANAILYAIFIEIVVQITKKFVMISWILVLEDVFKDTIYMKNAVVMPYAKKEVTAATILIQPVLLNYAQLVVYIRVAIKRRPNLYLLNIRMVIEVVEVNAGMTLI